MKFINAIYDCFLTPKSLKKKYKGPNKWMSLLRTTKQAKLFRRILRQQIIMVISITIMIMAGLFLETPIAIIIGLIAGIIVMPLVIFIKIPAMYKSNQFKISKKTPEQPLSFKVINRLFSKNFDYYK